MMKLTTTLSVVLLLSLFLSGLASAESFVVTYRSLDQIYIDGGREDGLAVGDFGHVRRHGQTIAEIAIAHLAAHSASCDILSQSSDIAVGDSVDVMITIMPESEPSGAEPVNPEDSARWSPTPLKPQSPRPEADGSVGLRVSYWNDQGPADMDLVQTNADFRIRARNLLNQKLGIAFRTRARHNQRGRALSDDTPAADWDNRIYEFSATYGGENDQFHLYMGRVAPRQVAGIGAIDGVLIEERFSDVRLGSFAGIEPDWQYQSSDQSLRKYGGYLGYDTGARLPTGLGVTIAAVAEYHASTVSRQFLSTQGRLSVRNRLHISQTAEFDVNTGWRRDIAGESISLSNLYVHTRYQFAPSVAASVDFDNRKNHWSLEVRDLADSLFDDNLNQGLRGRVDVRLPLDISAQLGAGIRDRGDNQRPTRTYMAGLQQSGAFWSGLSLRASASSFSGRDENGYNATFYANQSLPSRMDIGASYVLYHYSLDTENLSRNNRRIEFTLRTPLYRQLRLDALYQHNTGDDTTGDRVESGLQWHF